MKIFLKKIMYLRISDFLSFFILLISVPYALILKKTRPHIWLFCERKEEARDNAYWLYKYTCENHPQVDAVYAIDNKSPDIKKIRNLGGTVIPWGGIKHWAYYLAAEYNISSQKAGKPNAAICYFFEVFDIWKNKRIFLQHGVIHNDTKFLYYKNTKMTLFVCSAFREYQYVSKYFGYPKESVKLLGLARFDGLYDWKNENLILIMPTWRKELSKPISLSKRIHNNDIFLQSDYYQAWENFIEDNQLNEFLEKSNFKVIFYPHQEMQKYLHLFQTKSKNIIFANWKHYEVQDLLKKSAFLITDYSSIAFDFAYMGKPLLYYQFDQDSFRKNQYSSGYFDYEYDGFGPVCKNNNEVLKTIKYFYNREFKNTDKYKKRAEQFFSLHDDENCKRTYEAICSLK